MWWFWFYTGCLLWHVYVYYDQFFFFFFTTLQGQYKPSLCWRWWMEDDLAVVVILIKNSHILIRAVISSSNLTFPVKLIFHQQMSPQSKHYPSFSLAALYLLHPHCARWHFITAVFDYHKNRASQWIWHLLPLSLWHMWACWKPSLIRRNRWTKASQMGQCIKHRI